MRDADAVQLLLENKRLLAEKQQACEENARMRDALEEIRSTHWDRRVNQICRRGLGIPDHPHTVALRRELDREMGRVRWRQG